jgi:hypothetical protein
MHNNSLAICFKFYLSAVGVNNKQAPEPFCCITDETQPNRGIAGFFYSSGSGPITVLDAKTLLLPRFTFEGTKPPGRALIVFLLLHS